MNSNASARGTMSDEGSRRMRLISSPTMVPPGSRTATTSLPRAASHSASNRSCVLLPAPSAPSNTTSSPRGMRSAKGDDRTRGPLLYSLEDPVVHAAHGLVEVLLRDEQTLIGRTTLDLPEQRIELALHLFSRTLPALQHALGVDAKLLHPLEQRHRVLVVVQRVAGAFDFLVFVGLPDQA